VQKAKSRKPRTFEKHRGCGPQVVTQETGKRKAMKKAPGKNPGASLHYEIVD
jgi:hypothetical protein